MGNVSSPPGAAAAPPGSFSPSAMPSGYDGSPGSREALNDLCVREIHRLEAENRALLEEITEKRGALREAREVRARTLDEADRAIKFRMEKTESETKEAYFHELQQMKKQKQVDLADTVAELHAVGFREQRCLMQEDVRSAIMRDFDTTWRRVRATIVEEGTHKLQHALKISKEEHESIIADRQAIFEEEIKALRAKVQDAKRAKGGMFSGWFSPSPKRSHDDDDDDDDDDGDDEDGERDDRAGGGRGRKRAKR